MYWGGNSVCNLLLLSLALKVKRSFAYYWNRGKEQGKRVVSNLRAETSAVGEGCVWASWNLFHSCLQAAWCFPVLTNFWLFEVNGYLPCLLKINGRGQPEIEVALLKQVGSRWWGQKEKADLLTSVLRFLTQVLETLCDKSGIPRPPPNWVSWLPLLIASRFFFL